MGMLNMFLLLGFSDESDYEECIRNVELFGIDNSGKRKIWELLGEEGDDFVRMLEVEFKKMVFE